MSFLSDQGSHLDHKLIFKCQEVFDFIVSGILVSGISVQSAANAINKSQFIANHCLYCVQLFVVKLFLFATRVRPLRPNNRSLVLRTQP